MPTDKDEGPTTDFTSAGKKKSTIDVRVSYRIIELFSEGLYSSPNKAIEELVSNAFDAGAQTVHVVLPSDPTQTDATIAVFDDGTGMDEPGLKQHWLIGVSNKRDEDFVAPRGRKQIGKFGIGKLATYVLARRLTHISKRNGKYLATTMNFDLVPTGVSKGLTAENPVTIDVRQLEEDEAERVLAPWLDGKVGLEALAFFGKKAKPSWTVAILSNLKQMAADIQRGRLRWVLAHAMPLRDDFQLFLDGKKVDSSKITQKRVKKWILGKDGTELPKPAPDDGEATQDKDAGDLHEYGITYPGLGRVTGYIELFRDPIDTGKSEATERSNGFFVYVRGRLVNADDAGFGIDRNKLRHGTFSRFRMVLYADGLDVELRSSRESLREGPFFNIARNIAHGGFNLARAKLDEVESEEDPSSQISRRVDQSPAAFTRRPLASLLKSALDGRYSPRYVLFPTDLDDAGKKKLLDEVSGASEEGGSLVKSAVLTTELAQDQPIAVFDARSGTLRVNTLHPFVAYFLDDYEDKARSIPLELMAMGEVMLEATLQQQGIEAPLIQELLSQRDALLRALARSTGQRNARTVAQALEDAANDQAKLEAELVASTDSMGLDAIPLGGKGRADGRAEAALSAKTAGAPQSYAVSLEAKSKEKDGAKVSAKAVGVSTIARHRKAANCDHALVVAPDFPTSQGEASALAQEIADDRKANPGKTITLVRIRDYARLVRLVPLKRVGLDRLKKFFEDCSLPEQSKAWIDAIAAEKKARPPYKQILEAIWSEQKSQMGELVEFGALRVAIRPLTLSSDELKEACRSLARFAPGWVTVYENSIEIHTRPDLILAAVRAVIEEYPQSEAQATDLPPK